MVDIVLIEPCYRYKAEVLRVIDGDTFVARVDLGFRVRVDVELRLHGWSCPELSTVEGKLARLRAQELLVAPVVVESYRDQRSFSRWVADVYTDGQHLGELLGAEGLARQGAFVG